MKSIELFAGAGGLGMGISAAGFEPVDIVEWDKWCCRTIAHNQQVKAEPVRSWPTVRHGDIRDLSFTSFEDQIALVSGGPPCQPFSMGGLHKAHYDNRDMWSEAVRVVREVRPKAFLFENVKGLTRAAFKPYVSYIGLQLTYPEILISEYESWLEHLTRLEQHHTSNSRCSLTYNVLAPKVLNAADFGVAQRRERVFFVGFRADIDARWSWPEPTHSREALLWKQFRTGEYWDQHRLEENSWAVNDRSWDASERIKAKPTAEAWRTARDAICDLPDPLHVNSSDNRLADHRYQAGAKIYPGHTGSLLDEPAKTLKAGVHGVPGGENMLRRADGSVRYFTVRESARLQAFPDGYQFHGSWSEVMRQLGNAVPVTLAEVMARSIKDHLEKAAKRHRSGEWQTFTTH